MNEIMLVGNPRKRKRRRKSVKRKTTTRKRRRNPVAKKRRRRRNPRRVTGRGIQQQAMTALQGASGALVLDVALGYIPIPENLKGGIVGTGVKAALAIGLGILGQQTKLVSNATAAKLADGALTVVFHDELKRQVANFLPNVPMGEYLYSNADVFDTSLGYHGAGYNPAGMYLPDISEDDMGFEESGFGEYMDPDNQELYMQ